MSRTGPIQHQLYCVDQGPSREAYTVGFAGVVKIVKSESGAGPMGRYDVIHIFKGGKIPFAAMPAHQCEYWEFLNVQEDRPK